MNNDPKGTPQNLHDQVMWLEAVLFVYQARLAALQTVVSSIWQTAKPEADFRQKIRELEDKAVNQVLADYADSDPNRASKMKQMIDAAKKSLPPA